MVASEHTSHSPLRQLVERAEQLHLRAPELAGVLGQRAATLAESAGSNTLWVRAEGLVVLTTIRLGHRAGTVGRAVAGLRAAEDAGEDILAARLRTGLAVCARSVGVPLTGLAALRPALSGAGVPGAQRAAALAQLPGCVAGLAGKPELDKTFAQADRLCADDGTLSGDVKLVRHALLRVAVSAHRRRNGDLVGAADAARTGIGFLDGLEDFGEDGGVARARLVLELVTSLLDRGETAAAFDAAAPILNRPLRAAEIAPVAWLRLAIATRVHLASGAGHAATRLLRDALHDTDRYSMRALSARLRSELAHVEERMGRPADALETLRTARADERAHARLRGQAYAVLTNEFAAEDRVELDFTEILAEPAVAQRSGAESEPEPAAEEAASAPQESTAAGARRRERVETEGGSVLDRLGISGGGAERSGGRRRASDSGEEPQATQADEPEQVDWLPRLRLPPSLAPIEELTGAQEDTPLENDSTSVGKEVAREEPSADAGLAELLTRALAEHQAGTSSAATLIERLGSGSESAAGDSQLNGRHRNDD